MVFILQSFWTRCQKLLDVGAGAGAKILDAWSLEFEFRLRSPGLNHESTNRFRYFAVTFLPFLGVVTLYSFV